MSVLAWIMAVSLGGAGLTLLMTLWNLTLYRRPPERSGLPGADGMVSVCVPARNEEANLEACVRAVLASDHPVEVLVYDDESTDGTGEILARLCAEDPRVRTVPTVPMGEGWTGKQHGCERMGLAARGEWVLFTDADVRLGPTAVRRAVAEACERGVELVSTFPRQVCGTLGELVHVPMMFFILFSYLPFVQMRNSVSPSASAGCGQFLLARRASYRRAGGHAAFGGSMHDGIKMPRAVRTLGMRTDLFDGTDLASVRMYRGQAQSWRGFAKNAYEGLGSVGLLVFLTGIHALSHALPWVAAPVAFATGDARAGWLGLGAVGANVLQRLVLAWRFRHPPSLALLHPVTVVVMTAVQWHSFALHVRGRRAWKGRTGGAGGERVVLVDEEDRELGTAEKLDAHRDGGKLHRAFSVFLFDRAGRTLLQKRAGTKYHFGGLWTNACCGHPRPGETPGEGARRRLREEMGVDAGLEPAGRFAYTASDPGSGLTERELDHVLIGRFEGDPRPDPGEVEGWRWVEANELEREMRREPGSFTPWFAPAWAEARRALNGSARSAGPR